MDKKQAWMLILLFGVISLLGDIIYEGGRLDPLRLTDGHTSVYIPEIQRGNQNREGGERKEEKSLSETFWIFCVFTFFTVFGFVNFALVGYHLKINHIIPDLYIPLLYLLAMVVDGVSGMAIGKIYDRVDRKIYTLLVVPFLTAITIALLFSGNIVYTVLGMFVWGVVMGLHEVVFKAYIVDLVEQGKRGSAFGVFNLVYGVSAFSGGALTGLLYDISVDVMVWSLIAVQVIAVFSFKAIVKFNKS